MEPVAFIGGLLFGTATLLIALRWLRGANLKASPLSINVNDRDASNVPHDPPDMPPGSIIKHRRKC